MLYRNSYRLFTLSCLLTLSGCKTGDSALVKEGAPKRPTTESPKPISSVRYTIENNEVLASRCSQANFDRPSSWTVSGCEIIARMDIENFKEKAIKNYLHSVNRKALNDREKYVIESVINAKQHQEASSKELKSLRELSMEQVDHVIGSYTHIIDQTVGINNEHQTQSEKSAGLNLAGTTFITENVLVPFGQSSSPIFSLFGSPTGKFIEVSISGAQCGATISGVSVSTVGNPILGSLKNLGGGRFSSNTSGRQLNITAIQFQFSQTSFVNASCLVSASVSDGNSNDPSPNPGPIVIPDPIPVPNDPVPGPINPFPHDPIVVCELNDPTSCSRSGCVWVASPAGSFCFQPNSCEDIGSNALACTNAKPSNGDMCQLKSSGGFFGVQICSSRSVNPVPNPNPTPNPSPNPIPNPSPSFDQVGFFPYFGGFVQGAELTLLNPRFVSQIQVSSEGCSVNVFSVKVRGNVSRPTTLVGNAGSNIWAPNGGSGAFVTSIVADYNGPVGQNCRIVLAVK
jgi:hypothetical protein